MFLKTKHRFLDFNILFVFFTKRRNLGFEVLFPWECRLGFVFRGFSMAVCSVGGRCSRVASLHVWRYTQTHGGTKKKEKSCMWNIIKTTLRTTTTYLKRVQQTQSGKSTFLCFFDHLRIRLLPAIWHWFVAIGGIRTIRHQSDPPFLITLFSPNSC